MKFAKYWQKIDLPVDKSIFGRGEISVWGGSNDSPESARVSAENRAGKFKKYIANGFDKRSEYEYWTGFIKEEIVEEIKSDEGNVLAILTRNSYGATILNSEMVLFGDIDIKESGFIGRILESLGKRKKDKSFCINKIESYQKENSELSIKVYETFAGLRFVVTNRTFSPDESLTKSMFASLGVDPLYMRLCKQQTCFRARLTPKPWRIGVDRPGSRFPRKDGKEQVGFERWLKGYQTASSGMTATKLLKSFGVDKVHPHVNKVLKVHDDYACDTSSELA